MTTTPTSGEANLWPALITFSIAYLVVSAMVTAVLVYLDLNSNTGLSVAILIAATAAAAQKFVAGHGARCRAASSCALHSWQRSRRCC
jgi:hypothetical protein